MASAAVKNNPLKESSNKFNSSTSGKKAKPGVKTSKSKAGKNPGSSSGRSGSSKSNRSGKKKSGSKREKSNSKRPSGSNSGSQKKTKVIGSKDKEGVSRSETIKLSCGPDVYYVSSKHFAACSNLIKKELAVNAHARSVDLRQFDKSTVRVLAEYIESKKIKTDISFYSLAELLKFSKVFEMENLRTQLEKFITVIAANDLGTLHQVLLIIGVTSVSRPTERDILERAARNFMELAAQSTFQRTPFNIAITLFARCDLNVQSEVQLVDAMLLWLAGQANIPAVVPSLFYLVRHDFIHPVQKAFIVERARALRFPEDVIGAIERCFECGNGTRICVLKEHYEAKYTRCGIADTTHLDAKNPHMPLSIPREAIFYKPTTEEAATAVKQGTRTFHSSEARPYYHAPPACAGKSNKSKGGKMKSKSHKGGAMKGKTATQHSSKRSKSSEKSVSHKSNRSKKEIKPKTPGKSKKTSSTRDKSAKKTPVAH